MDLTSTLRLKNDAIAAWVGLALANELVQAMVKAPFTPSLSLVTGDVTIANFTGYVSQATSGGGAATYRNAAKGGTDILIRGDVDSWAQKCTNTVNLPQQIFGVIVSDGVTSNIFCSMLFDPPIPIEGPPDGASFELHLFTFFDTCLK